MAYIPKTCILAGGWWLRLRIPKTYAPEKIRFWRDEWQQLYMQNGQCTEGSVRVKRAFPLTDPDEFVIIEDLQGHFLGMIKSYRKMDQESVRVVDEEPEYDYFLPQILKIYDIRDDFRIMNWWVETDRGPRRFEVRSRRRDIRWLTDNHVVVQDADGNKYEIRDLSQLDESSRQKLEIEV